MNEDLDEKLKQAREDHKRIQGEYEIAKERQEKLQSGIDQLQNKYQELELAIEKQKMKLTQYENIYSDVDKTIKANQQQENKVALAESAADSVIEGYLQTLREEKDNEDAGEGPSTSSAAALSDEREGLKAAIQQNRNILMELLQRVESIQKQSKNN